jgi:ribonucleoside-diphosphate reductase beta chain
MTLFEKAKRLGVWNPSDIDFTQDKKDWRKLTDSERSLLLHLTSMFQAGEEAVTLDLLPLIGVIAREGRLEEELYLTTFLFEEAKHTDFFHRFISEVAEESVDLSRFHGPCYRRLFYETLPETMHALSTNPSPAALARASATYNMVVEGMLAETGYYAYFAVLDRLKILPGQRKGIALLKQDESRHIAYGVFLLSRLMAEDDGLWAVIEATMNELVTPALGMIHESIGSYDPVPFGLRVEDFTDYAMRQFQKRFDRIQRARAMTMDEVYRVTHAAIEEDDA